MRGSTSTRIGAVLTLLVVVLAGCGGPQSASETSGGGSEGKSESAKGPWKIGLSVFFQGNSFQAQNVQTFQDACKELGSEVVESCTVANANGATPQQIAQVQGFINQGYDAILIDANNDTGLNAVIKQAMDRGIAVVNYNTLINGEATMKVGVEEEKWGEITGKWLIEQLGGRGNIIVLNGLAGNPVSKLRWAGAEKLIKQQPGMKVLNIANADWDQAKAQAAVARMLDAYPKIDGVWSQGGAMTAGAMIEFQQAGRPLVPMTGEAYNGFLRLWTENQPKGFESIALGVPNYLVTIALQGAVKKLGGEEIPELIKLPLPQITDETVKDHYRPDKPDSYWVLDSISQAEIDKLLTPS